MASIVLDSGSWYLRARVDGHHKAIRIGKKDDRLHSKKDVLSSEEYKQVVEGLNNGHNEAEVRLLQAAKNAGLDSTIVSRLLRDKAEDKLLLSSFVEDIYFPHITKELRARTVAEARSIWNRYKLSEEFAGLTVAAVQPKHIVAVLEKIAPSVATRTLQHIKFFLSAVFAQAMSKGYRESNPVTGTKLPKAAREPRETYAYSLREVLAILALPLPIDVKAALAIAAFAGLRLSELQGLEWEDLSDTTLHVCRSIDRLSKQACATKTQASAQPVPVIPQLGGILERYRTSLPHAVGRMFPHDLDKVGRRIIRPTAAAAKVQWRGWHAFRRGLATTLNDARVPLLTVQAILRHSSPEVTEECYVKRLPAQSLEAMDTLSRAVQECTGLYGKSSVNAA